MNYNSTENQFVSLPRDDSVSNLARQRSMSFSGVSVNSSVLQDEAGLPMSHQEIRAPGGFRRSFILHKHQMENKQLPYLPNFIVTNFNEFLGLYGHFAGEDLSESEDEGADEGSDEAIEDEDEVNVSLLRPRAQRRLPRLPRVKPAERGNKTSTFKAILLLLKSFVGTGILFLPKGFSNGGYSFSTMTLLTCSLISYYCFILLISTKDQNKGIDGYGDLGNHLYGYPMKLAILFSIALSQIGFAAAYTVFVATNLKTICNTVIPKVEFTVTNFIILQTVLFVPLSFTRKISKLTATALIADLFIFFGLIYLYYYPITYIAEYGIAKDKMVAFNKESWSLFIGTAIFTFEGIGLLIPIQESMAHPHQFHGSLSLVMIVVTVIFLTVGLLSYSAFGSSVETVVLLNFPQNSPYTIGVQILYSLAILLSTPLQLFPAIRILENWIFKSKHSGKHNPKIKWAKNHFRSVVVVVTTTIAWLGAEDLDKFVSLVGSFACIPLIYVYPPLLHMKSLQNKKAGHSWAIVGDIALVVIGVVLMTYTTWQTVKLWFG